MKNVSSGAKKTAKTTKNSTDFYQTRAAKKTSQHTTSDADPFRMFPRGVERDGDDHDLREQDDDYPHHQPLHHAEEEDDVDDDEDAHRSDHHIIDETTGMMFVDQPPPAMNVSIRELSFATHEDADCPVHVLSTELFSPGTGESPIEEDVVADDIIGENSTSSSEGQRHLPVLQPCSDDQKAGGGLSPDSSLLLASWNGDVNQEVGGIGVTTGTSSSSSSSNRGLSPYHLLKTHQQDNDEFGGQGARVVLGRIIDGPITLTTPPKNSGSRMQLEFQSAWGRRPVCTCHEISEDE
eukprot:GSA25T00003465001.1